MQLRVRVDRRLLELALECGDLDLSQRRPGDLRERGPGAMEARLETQSLAVLELCRLQLADELQRRREVVVIGGFVAIARDCTAERFERLGMRAGARHDDADGVERQRVAWLETEGLGSGFECFARAVERDQAATAMGEVFGLLRCDRDRALDDLESLAEIAMLGREHAEQEPRVRVVRLSSENL